MTFETVRHASESSEARWTVMLVDDHSVVRAGYRMLLESSGEFTVIFETETGETAIKKYAELQPDVVVMDLNLPGISGLETTRKMVKDHPMARVLIFSIHDESIYVARAFDAGAKGFLCKSSSTEEMAEAVRVVARGKSYTGTNIARPSNARRSIPKDPLELLTRREFEVFQLLGKGADSKEIAATLGLSAKTASNYTISIKEKLYLGSTAELVRLATQHASRADI